MWEERPRPETDMEPLSPNGSDEVTQEAWKGHTENPRRAGLNPGGAWYLRGQRSKRDLRLISRTTKNPALLLCHDL